MVLKHTMITIKQFEGRSSRA